MFLILLSQPHVDDVVFIDFMLNDVDVDDDDDSIPSPCYE
jgi:hypothetical protein